MTKLRKRSDGYAWYCPACECFHGTTGWQFDGNMEAPTFSPSFLFRSGHHIPNHKPGDDCWCTFNVKQENKHYQNRYECSVCHTFVRNGMIEYLSDCTHKYAGQVVPLPDLDNLSNMTQGEIVWLPVK